MSIHDCQNTRSAAHASADGVRFPSEWPGVEYGEIEHVQVVEPDDTISRLARAHAESRSSLRDVQFDLADDPAPNKPARVPRDTEPCNLVAFCGIVAGGAAAVVGAAALLGWSIHAAMKWAGWM